MTINIAIIVEGATEKAFRGALLGFLSKRLAPGDMPRIRFVPRNGRLPKGDHLKHDVDRLLEDHDAIIALTDVYTGDNPEAVNHQKPPSRHLEDAFRTGQFKRAYEKTLDGIRILRGQDLAVSAAACPELKAFLNTILTLSGGPPL